MSRVVKVAVAAAVIALSTAAAACGNSASGSTTVVGGHTQPSVVARHVHHQVDARVGRQPGAVDAELEQLVLDQKFTGGTNSSGAAAHWNCVP